MEYSSIFLTKLTNNDSDKLQDKDNIKNYFAKGLASYPNLQFNLINVFAGVSSIVLHYESVNDLMVAEVFELDDSGLAIRVQCYYYQS